MAKKTLDPADFIVPLNMNGLEGRMLHLPAPAKHKRELLFIYGQHSSLERWWGLSQALNQYAAVTMPDLPGFGGMDSFYKIGKEPTIDNLADYLASFIKLHYKKRRLSIGGMSIGFIIITRMLQRYPELTKQVDMLVSIVGFAHHDDFIFSKPRMAFYTAGSTLFSKRLPAWIFRYVFLQPAWLRRAYRHSQNAKEKFEGKEGEDFNAIMEMEIKLWHQNDLRTQMFTNLEMFRLDNCTKRIDLPVYHVAVDADRYFDNRIVEQHYHVIFPEVHMTRSAVETHAPSVISDAKTAAPYIPAELRRALLKT